MHMHAAFGCVWVVFDWLSGRNSNGSNDSDAGGENHRGGEDDSRLKDSKKALQEGISLGYWIFVVFVSSFSCWEPICAHGTKGIRYFCVHE